MVPGQGHKDESESEPCPDRARQVQRPGTLLRGYRCLLVCRDARCRAAARRFEGLYRQGCQGTPTVVCPIPPLDPDQRTGHRGRKPAQQPRHCPRCAGHRLRQICGRQEGDGGISVAVLREAHADADRARRQAAQRVASYVGVRLLAVQHDAHHRRLPAGTTGRLSARGHGPARESRRLPGSLSGQKGGGVALPADQRVGLQAERTGQGPLSSLPARTRAHRLPAVGQGQRHPSFCRSLLPALLYARPHRQCLCSC